MMILDIVARNTFPIARSVAASREAVPTSTLAAFRPDRLMLFVGLGVAVAFVAWLQLRRAEALETQAPGSAGAVVRPGGLPGTSAGRWFAKKLGTMKSLGAAGSVERLITRSVDFSDDIQDRWFDLVHRTDTAQVVQLADLSIQGQNEERGGRYAPTTARAFRAIMKGMDFPPDSVFVDVGSGKGKTLLLASEYGFKRVVGVEFAAELNEQARRNWSIYRRGRDGGPDFEVVTIDAAEYDIKDDENVFFLFNPFDDVVMTKFVQNLDASHARRPRPIWVIYQNPVAMGVFERHDAFSRIKQAGKRGGAYAVYAR